MKNSRILLITIIGLSLFGCGTHISESNFKKIEGLKGEVGISENQKKADALEILYNSTDRDAFEATLLKYLKTTSAEEAGAYGDYASYFLEDHFTKIHDEELGLRILGQGLEDLDFRIKNSSNEDEQLNLNMARCRVLWMTGIFYYEQNDLEKGGEYFDLAMQNPDCEWNFPARDDRETLFNKYSDYKKERN